MNKLFTKIAAACVGIAMAVGVGVVVTSNQKGANPVFADETYNQREFAFTSSPLPDGYAISSSGGYASSLYKMSNSDYATLDSSVLFNDGEVLSSSTMVITVKIGTHGTWSGAKTAKYRVAFLDSNGDELSYAIGDSKNGMSNSAAYTNGPNVTLNAPADPSEIAKLKITFSDLTSTASGYLRFAGAKLTYETETADASAVTTVEISASGSRILDLNGNVQLSSVVKDANSSAIGGATVTYTSSDPTVASVSASGLVTASSSKYGSTIITASYAGLNGTYNASSASVLIRVSNPTAPSFVIKDIAVESKWENGNAYTSLGTIGAVSIVGSGDPNNTYYYSSGNGTWRFYNTGSGQFTVSTSAGYLKTVTLVTDGSHAFTSAPSNWTYSNNVFTASDKLQTSATFSNGDGTSKIERIDVTIGYACTVSYNANGGSGTMTDTSSPYDSGSTVTVKANTFTAPNNTVFDHWDTKADDSGIDYDAGNTFTISANTTLYAQWVAASENAYVNLTLTSAQNPYKGTTITITAASGNLEGDGLDWTVTAGTITNQSTSNTSFSGKLASTGTVTVRATDNDGDTYDEVSVTVNAVTLSLDESTLSLYPEASATLTATVNTGSVTWVSGNTSDATVAADAQNALKGVVSVPSNATVGHTAVITATSTIDDTVTATCTVTVVAFVGYTKVTSTSGLVVGDSYVIGVENSSEGAKLMGGVGGNGTSTYRLSVDASSAFNADKSKIVASSIPNTVVVVTLLSDGDGGYYFYDITSNKYLAGQSGNYVVDQTSLSDATPYSISFSNGHMDVGLKNTTRVFGYNVGSPRFSTYASYASYNYTMTNGTAHLILFHVSGSSVKTNVTSFANTSLKMNDEAYQGDKTTANCASNYEAMKTAYVALSDAEKNVFQYSDDYSAARARLNKWATANHETFTYGENTPFGSVKINVFTNDSGTTATIVTVTSLITVTGLGAFLFLKKRKEI